MSPFSSEIISSELIRLNSCGCQHFFEKGAECSRPLGRTDYHILYITEGTCFVPEGDSLTAATAGSVVIFPPGVPHDYRFPQGVRSTSYFIHFSGQCCEGLFGFLREKQRRVFRIGVSASLEELLTRLVSENKLKLPQSDYSSLGYLLAAISIISRKIIFTKSDCSATAQKITEACRYMHTALRDDIPIGEYAKMCNLSESRFSHLFKDIMGKSPKAYILGIRISMAKELLENSELNVSEIADSVGIPNQYYFSRLFKKYTGAAPSEYRRTFSRPDE